MRVVFSGKYEVLDLLGQGGMASVYKVRHTKLDTIRALKALPREFMAQSDMVQRFYREARLMAQLVHPNIVRVYDVERDDKIPCLYFVMEYIRGQNLRQYMRDRGPLPLLQVLEMARQVAKALAHAHMHNPPVIHRDIKPSNIMVEDGSGRVVVTDFGIAKELDRNDMTQSGVVLGTLNYCAPEQFRHEPVDAVADIYALGMVMYEAYEGKPFFGELAEHEVIAQLRSENGENIPRFMRPTPPAFVSLITRAIAKSRTRRYPGVDVLLQDLEACWAASGDTKTFVISSNGSREDSSPLEKPGNLDDLKKRIRELEEEQHKLLALEAQTQAQESREHAVEDGGGRWATKIFQQGLSCEEQGHALLHARDYEHARASYQEAQLLFIRAGQEAKTTALIHQTEQARQEMTAAKTEAERYRARERARTFYGRGLALQVQADELWNERAYEKAKQLYTEASNSFEDARELAYRLGLKGAAEAARDEMRNVQEQAMRDGAEEFAFLALQEAVRAQQQAEAALGLEEFTQAREFYAMARQQYEQARNQALAARAARAADLQRLQQQAARALLQAQDAQSRALREGVQRQFPGEFAQAGHLIDQGKAYEQRGEVGEAVRVYEQAVAKFTDLYQETKRLVQLDLQRQREAMRAAKQQALDLQQIVEKETLPRSVDELLRHAHEAKQKAEQAEVSERWNEATTEFTHVSSSFQEILVRMAEEVRRDTLALRTEVESLGAPEKAAVLYQRGVACVMQATVHWEAAAYQQAKQGYDEARAIFLQAREQTRQENLKEHANHARREIIAVRQNLQQEGVNVSNPGTFREAWNQEQHGETALREGNFGLAAEMYESAKQKYTAARQQSIFDHQRQHALTAQQEAERAQQEATAAEAQQSAPNLFEQANEARHEGEAKLSAQQWEDAAERFARATHLFTQARYEARLTKARLAAEDARNQALAAQIDVAAVQGEVLFPGRLEQATERLREAEKVFSRREFSVARRAFLESVSLFSGIRHDTLVVRQREQVEQLRQQVFRLRNGARTLQPVQAQQVGQLLYEGEQLFHRRQYVEAREYYTKALALLTSLQDSNDSTFIKEGKKFTLSHRLTFVVLALLLVVVLSLYFLQYPPFEKKQEAGRTEYSPKSIETDRVRPPSLASTMNSESMVPQQAVVQGQGSEEASRKETNDIQSLSLPTTTADATSTSLQEQSLSQQKSLPIEWSNATEENLTRLSMMEGLEQRDDPHTSEVYEVERKPPQQENAQDPPLPSGPFLKLAPVRQVMADNVLELHVPIANIALAFLDERNVPILPNGVIRETLSPLPVGESVHKLILVNGAAKAQEMQLTLTYYPRWEVRQIKDGSNEVYFVTFSPDGRFILVGSRDKTLKLWDVKDGRKVRTFTGHEDWVNGIAIAPNGKMAASGSDDTTVRIWDMGTGQSVRVLTGHTGVVQSVGFSPDGDKIISASSDNVLKLWDVKTGAELHTFRGHTGWVWATAFSPDGHMILSGSEDKTLKLWSVASGQEVRTLSGHSRGITAVAFSPDGKTLLSGGSDGVLRLWETLNGTPIRTWSGHNERINSVAFSSDGKMIISGSKDKTLKLWEAKSGQLVRTFLGHEATVIGAAFSPDGQLIASGGRDKTIRIWWGGPELSQ